MISLISALGNKRAIGKNNALLWDIPEDMKRFRELTKGKPIIMGKKTFESIGKPLPNRKNIILAFKKDFDAPGCYIATTPDEALRLAEGSEEVMVIGGAMVYTLFLPMAKKMYLTLVHENFDADAFFPEYDEKDWNIVKKQEGCDQKSGLKFTFIDYEKKY